MSNLCQEITLPTKPIQHIDDENGEIALCILSAINVGKVKSDTELENLCDLSVRALDELIDYQQYPVKAAEIATRARRSLGIGFYRTCTLSCQVRSLITTHRRHGMLYMDSQNHSNIPFESIKSTC